MFNAFRIHSVNNLNFIIQHNYILTFLKLIYLIQLFPLVLKSKVKYKPNKNHCIFQTTNKLNKQNTQLNGFSIKQSIITKYNQIIFLSKLFKNKLDQLFILKKDMRNFIFFIFFFYLYTLITSIFLKLSLIILLLSLILFFPKISLLFIAKLLHKFCH